MIFHLWLYFSFELDGDVDLENWNHFNFSQLFNIFQCYEMNWIKLCGKKFQSFCAKSKIFTTNYVTAFELFSSNAKHKFKNLSTFFSFCIVLIFNNFHFIFFKSFSQLITSSLLIFSFTFNQWQRGVWCLKVWSLQDETTNCLRKWKNLEHNKLFLILYYLRVNERLNDLLRA